MTIDTGRLPEFLRSRRWFGGKGAPIKSVQVIEQADLAGYQLAVLEVVYELGLPERYLAPLKQGPGGTLEEGLDDDDLPRELLRVVRDQKRIPSAGGLLRGEYLADAGALHSLSAQPSVRRIVAEQSNTSIVFDERAIMKVIRKIDFGNHPEWEMGQFLRKHGFTHTPPLLGGVVLEGAVHSTLALVHEFVPVEADGWAWMLAQFRSSPTPSQAVLAELRKLGERLAQMHTVLASPSDDPGFAPEPIHREDLQRWASSIIGELGVTIAAARDHVPELARLHDPLIERINRLAKLEPSGLKIRHHGDFHLGQILRSAGDWLIFDFEGEPARSYAQRREKHTPIRDVAGLVRSLAYACAAVELEGAPEGNRLRPARRVFLEGYRAASRVKDLLPRDGDFDMVLQALEVEKLLYELRYEINHRPKWVPIPARTLLSLEASG
ncbi:MAG TPA: sugar phosphotransferase [Myxococcaceae bacterium]|nr:sugar phosphotransferase [Myxococcaceae bacterium]